MTGRGFWGILCLLLLFIFSACGPRVEEPTPAPRSQKKARKEPVSGDLLVQYTTLKMDYDAHPTKEKREVLIAKLHKLALTAEMAGNARLAREYWSQVLILDAKNAEAWKKLNALSPHLPPPPDPAKKEMASSGSPLKVEQEKSGGKVLHFNLIIRGNAPWRNQSRVSYLLNEAYMDVGSRLGLYPDGAVDVYLYTDNVFRDITGLPPWVKGIYDGAIHLPVGDLPEDDPSIKRVIYHEYTHAVIYHLSHNRCPLWLNEGLAQLMEPGGRNVDAAQILKLKKSGNLPDLNSPSFLSQGARTAQHLYGYAYLVTKYLVDSEGEWALDNFFKALRKGERVDTAFEEAYLFPMSDLPERFFQSLQR